MLTIEKTQRGFALAKFVDRYDIKCSIQDSSIATEACLWLGVDDPQPQITARDAVAIGREDLLKPVGDPERLNGWVSYPLPAQVSLSTRMHLTVEQVKALLPVLQTFVETGSIDGD